ncbi:MAG: hypothetical protein SVJ22_02050 [Halobacteriota archaeon]|nr:hypothetical protein [Halobacteriota archaeon]
MMKELEVLESELKQERKKLLQNIDTLVKDGKSEAAIKQVEDAAKITERLKGVDEAKGLEASIDKLEAEKNDLKSRNSKELDSIDAQEKEIYGKINKLKADIKSREKNLIEERDRLLENIELLVEDGKAKEAISQVKAAGNLSKELLKLESDEEDSKELSDLKKELEELSKKKHDLDNKIDKELLEIESHIRALRDEQNVKAGGLEVGEVQRVKEEPIAEKIIEEVAPPLKQAQEIIPDKEEDKPLIEEVEVQKEEPQEVVPAKEEEKPLIVDIEVPKKEVEVAVEEVQEPKNEKEHLTKVEYLILNGIAEGFTTPKKLAKKINVDESFIKDKIEDLRQRGYLG